MSYVVGFPMITGCHNGTCPMSRGLIILKPKKKMARINDHKCTEITIGALYNHA